MTDKFKFYRRESRSLFSEIQRKATNAPTWLPLKVDKPVDGSGYSGVDLPVRAHTIFRIRMNKQTDFEGLLLFDREGIGSYEIDLKELDGSQKKLLNVTKAISWRFRIVPKVNDEKVEKVEWPDYFLIDSIIYPGKRIKKLERNRDIWLEPTEDVLLDKTSFGMALYKSKGGLIAQNTKEKIIKQDDLPEWIFKFVTDREVENKKWYHFVHRRKSV